jgi:hypothetical protein
LDEKNTVEELKAEWKRLWAERIDDWFRAEGIANRDYSALFVERGTVILATRNFTLPSFKDILERHGIIDAHRFAQPNYRVGGWGKFVRLTVTGQRLKSRVNRVAPDHGEKGQKQHLKKGGRGWVHL